MLYTNYQKRLVIISSICFGTAIIVGLAGFIYNDNLSESAQILFFVVLLAILLIMLIFGRYWLSKTQSNLTVWLNPPLLITGWIFITWGLPGLYSFLNKSLLSSDKIYTTISYSYTVFGFYLVVVGVITIWISYVIGLRVFPTFGLLKIFPSNDPSLQSLLLLYVITVIIQIFQIVVTGIAFGADTTSWGVFGRFQQWIGYLQELNILIIAILASMTFKRKIKPVYLIGIVIIQLIFGFSSGFIKPVFWIGLILLLSAIVSGVKPRSFILPTILSLILVILVVPIAENLRSQFESNIFNPRDPIEVIAATQTAFMDTWINGVKSSVQILVDRTLFRQALIANIPGIIMTKTPSIYPYQGLADLLMVPAYIIPRAVWSSKPITAKGVWFSINYLNLPSFTTSSGAMTIFGEGYIFYGWIGSIIISFILGGILSLLFKNTVLVGLTPVFIALLPTFLDVETQFSGLFVALIQKAVIFLFVYWILCKVSIPKFNSVRISNNPGLN